MLLSESYKKRLQELAGVDKLQSDAIGYNVGKYIYHATIIIIIITAITTTIKITMEIAMD